jgi:hypothetical protein
VLGNNKKEEKEENIVQTSAKSQHGVPKDIGCFKVFLH